MTVITIDASVAQVLERTRERVTLCDVEGKVLGVFLPAGPADQPPGPLVSPFTKEELDRRAKSGTGKTTSEIMERLNREYPIN